MQDVRRQLPVGQGMVANNSLALRIFNIDVPIFFSIIVLTAFGLVVLYSASGQDISLVERQFRFYLLGYVLMFLASNIRVNPMIFFRKLKPAILV